jgi:signal peptidase II
LTTSHADADAVTTSAEARGGARTAAVGALALVTLAAVGLDLVAKQAVLTNLSDGHAVRLLGGVLYFDLTRNGGAAFSIGTGVTFIFPIIAVLVLGVIIYLARRLRSMPWAVAMGLITGGAVGNLLDRLFRAPGPLRGHVVDFISVFGPNGQYFPIFNVADSALFCGVVLAIVLEFTGRRRDLSRAEGVKRSR